MGLVRQAGVSPETPLAGAVLQWCSRAQSLPLRCSSVAMVQRAQSLSLRCSNVVAMMWQLCVNCHIFMTRAVIQFIIKNKMHDY